MGTLTNLDGVREKETPCVFFTKPSQIEKILIPNGVFTKKAATAAGDNGAINIWSDDFCFFRCEAMRHYHTLDTLKTLELEEVKTWAKKWIKIIK